jgi:ADP-ribose pyrophosphatase YjhB (NUDIX family)
MARSEYFEALRRKVGHDRLHVPAVSIVVLDESERILLVRQAEDSKWSIPGGMVEPGELPSDGAMREMKEETGFDVELTGIVGVFGGANFVNTYPNGDVASWVEITFRATVIGGEPRPEVGETLEVRFFSEKEIGRLDLKPYMTEILGVVFRRDSATYFRGHSGQGATR